MVVANVWVSEFFVCGCPCRSGHYNFLFLHKWESVLPLRVRALTMGCPAYFRLYSFEARAMEYKAQVKETDLIWSQICSSLRHILRMHARSVASVVSDSVGPHGLWPTRLLCPWDSPGKSNGVGCRTHLHTHPPLGCKPLPLSLGYSKGPDLVA